MVFKDIPTIRVGHLIFNFGGTNVNGQTNFIPFKTIMSYLNGSKGLVIATINIIGNIALLLPFGFLLRFIFKSIDLRKTLSFAVLAGLVIEGTQVIFNVGIFDIDDVILNAFGVLIGVWLCILLIQWKK